MPKMKTHRGAAKRFKLTGSGRVKRSRANAGHMMNVKNARRARRLRTGTLVSDTQQDSIKKLLGL